MSDWFRRRLSAPPAAPPQPPSYPSPREAQPNYGTMHGQAVQTVQQSLQRLHAPPNNDTSQIRVTMDNLADVVQYWQGGQGTTEETTICPKCGSRNYFSRKYTESGSKYKVPPAPQCAECNYTDGLYNLTSENVSFRPH